jgi:hypothetical protein
LSTSTANGSVAASSAAHFGSATQSLTPPAGGVNTPNTPTDLVVSTCWYAFTLRVEGPHEATNVGAELNGVRSGVEPCRRRVSGSKARDPGRIETTAGR